MGKWVSRKLIREFLIQDFSTKASIPKPNLGSAAVAQGATKWAVLIKAF